MPLSQPQQQTLETIFEASPAFMAYLEGPHFKFERANEKYYKLIGHRDILGKTVLEVLPEVQAQGFLTLLKGVYETKKAYVGTELPLQIESYEGGGFKQVYVDFVYQPLLNDKGQVLGIIAQGYDVTEKVEARKKTEEIAQKYKTMMDSIPEMIWSTLPDGYHDFYNKRWYEFTGAPVGSTDGEGWNGMFHPDDQAIAWKKWRHSLETGEPYEIEYRLRHHSGQYRWVLGRALPTRDGNGKIVRWMGTCTDIEAQKTAEENLRRSQENLEKVVQARTKTLTLLNEELEAFNYSVSHDLRTPLRSVEGFSQALLEDESPKLSERGKKDLQRIIDAGQTMGKLIDDLLTLSRLTRKEMNQKSVNLSDVAAAIEKQLVQANPGRKVEFQMGSTPAVYGDPGLLNAMMENLLSNAWKFTSVREIAKISFSFEEVQGQPTFVLRDNGAGFDMAFYDKLFGAFQRLHKSAEFSGTGVGLALVRRIINRHGGEIWAESRVNEGATFYFRLPLAK